MRKKPIIIIAVILLIFGIAAAGYSLVTPDKTANDSLEDIPGEFITPTSRIAQESSEEQESIPEPETTQPTNTTPEPRPEPAAQPRIPTATLTGVSGRFVTGTARIITTTEGNFIRLEDDFDSSSAAPDNRVYLGNANGFQIEISKLRAIKGAQNFQVPSNIDVSQYTHIWIHCKAFNQTYGVGEIIR